MNDIFQDLPPLPAALPEKSVGEERNVATLSFQESRDLHADVKEILNILSVKVILLDSVSEVDAVLDELNKNTEAQIYSIEILEKESASYFIAIHDGRNSVWVFKSDKLKRKEKLASLPLVTHSAKYKQVLMLQQGIRLENLHCTQLEYNAIENQECSADDSDFSIAVKEKLDIEIPSLLRTYPNTQIQQDYVALCAVTMHKLHEGLSHNLSTNSEKTKLYERMKKAVPAIASKEHNGLPINVKKYDAACEQWQQKRRQTKNNFHKEIGKCIDPAHPTQANSYYSSLGLDATKRFTHPSFKLLKEHRFMNYLCANFGLETVFYRAVNRDRKRVYTTYPTPGTVTGRITSQTPPLQGVPKKRSEIRCFIEAPKNHLILSCDYKAFEPRILAYEFEDPEMMRIFSSEQDFHSATAERLGISRTQAKEVNHAVAYGKSATTLAEDLNQPYQFAEVILNEYDNTYKVFAKRKSELIRQARQTKQLSTRGGRTRYFQREPEGYRDTQAVNTIAQGTAGDIFFAALGNLPEWLHPFIIHSAHDEILMCLSESEINRAATKLISVMTNAFLEFYPKAQGQTIVDVKVGKTWGNLKELEIKI